MNDHQNELQAALESITEMTEVLSGVRNQLLHAGFSEPAAEQIAVQQHAVMMHNMIMGAHHCEDCD